MNLWQITYGLPMWIEHGRWKLPGQWNFAVGYSGHRGPSVGHGLLYNGDRFTIPLLELLDNHKWIIR